jgi:sugar/nucleoside kinase (ribokinase family)
VEDIVMRVEKFPSPGAKIPASNFIVTGGGCSANAALTVARLGGRAAFAGPLGGHDDNASNRIIAGLAAEGVDCAGVERTAGGSASVSLILLDAEGEKSVATRRGAGLNQVAPKNALRLVADVDAVLMDNRFPDFVMPVARAARVRNIPVVLDFDLATRLDDALLNLGSHVIASSEALRGSTGLADLGEALKRLAEHVTGFLAVTDGANGVIWLEDGNLRTMPAFAVGTVDTLGAGDVFHGAFALALKCARFGGGAGAPRRAEVETLMKQQTGC